MRVDETTPSSRPKGVISINCFLFFFCTLFFILK
jgi:hypothetical protein